MARVWSTDGYLAADGLQGCEVCDEAIQTAQRIADEWGEAVELEDDDGSWLGYQAVDGERPAAQSVPS